jgi:hypothetical protein
MGGPELLDDSNLLASDFGATPGALSSRYGIIGDFFGGAYQMQFSDLAGTRPGPGPGVTSSNIAIGGGDRRFKIADSNSPIPVDRVFFNYNHFHNALTTVDGRETHLDRGVLGLEMATSNLMSSFEIRLPFASGLSSTQTFSQTADNTGAEFGNLSMAVKQLMCQTPTMRHSVGFGIVVPTAEESVVFDAFGRRFATVENEAVYLQPFTGLLWTPNDQFFVQLFGQLDVDCSGNTVRLDQTGQQGVIQDQYLLFADASFGYWLYHDANHGIITGVAPMLELHYTTTLSDTDVLTFTTQSGLPNTVSNPDNRLDVLNITGGVRLEIQSDSFLTIAAVAPLRDDGDHLFDAEVSAQYIRFY